MRTWLFSLTLLLTLLSSTAFAAEGDKLFLQKCAACHTIGDGNRVGPDLLGVNTRRDPAWLERWIRSPDRMLAEKDPTAVALLEQFKQVPMPNLGLTEPETKALVEFIAHTSEAKKNAPRADTAAAAVPLRMSDTAKLALVIFLVLAAGIGGVFAMIARSTRDAVPAIDIKSAYRVRKALFFATALMLGTLLVPTLARTPYADGSRTPDRLVYVAAKQFGFVYSAEPITNDEELGRVALIDSLELEAGTLVEFRVTSLDVTHNFAIYAPDRSIIAETQAMPGYVNRLRVRFAAPGRFEVLCLEYCGAAHQIMRSMFIVRNAHIAEVSK